MKKLILAATGLLATLLTAQAQFFTNGNLAVVRLSGFDTTSSTGATVYVDQYTTNGALVGSFKAPTSGSQSFILNGQAYEGLLNITPDNSRLVLAGYNTSLPYASNIVSSESGLVPRVVATLDAFGSFNLVCTNMTNFNDSAVSAAASDGTNFWVAGTGPTPSATVPTGLNGVAYFGTATSGATTEVTPITLFSTALRGLTLASVNGGYQLYAIGEASNSTVNPRFGSFILSNISGTLPTTTTGASNYFPAAFPFDLVINPTGTIAYQADNDNGIIKYTNGGSGWISNYVVNLSNAQAGAFGASATAVTADWTQTPPVVYATTGETITNRIVVFQDTNATGADVITTFAKGNLTSGSSTNTYRGIRFVPVVTYPGFVEQPSSAIVIPGVNVTFTAVALGNPAPTYQWYSNGMAISGATSTSFTLSSVTVAESGTQVYSIASNSIGTAQSATAILTVLNPAITMEPIGATNFPSGPASTLCVTAEGTGTLAYQWFSNGVPISGATMSCYTVASSAVSNSASYYVIVTNTAGANVTTATSTTTVVAYTPYLLYDTFSYPNGNLFGDVGSTWTDINGTNPELVTNGTVQISVSNATTDAQKLYTTPVNNTVVWASFTLNVSQLPSNAGGVYFENFEDTNFGFFGRLFLLTSNAPNLTPDISPIAYPGTYRLGIANSNNDSAGTSTTGPSAVVELDMAPGINYNVVAYYDIANNCQLAVNPSQTESNQIANNQGTYNGTGNNPSPLTSGPAGDRFTPSALPMAAQGLRQRTGGGIMTVDNLEVSYDYSGAFSGFAAVTAGFAPALANIGFLTPSFTNYTGNSNVLEVAASGIDLTYQWLQGANQLSDGNSLIGSSSAALTINPEVGSNSGTYTVVISNSAGGVTSSNVMVDIITTPTPPSFTLPGALEPVGATIAEGASVTFTATAVGTGPITYAWNYDGSPLGGSATGSSLTLTGVSTNQAGTYTVTATGADAPAATSSNALLIVNGPTATNIHFLRSLISPSTFAVSDTTDLYTIQGTVVNATNLTSGNTASYYVQDATGGINLFITGDSTFRPALGDIVNATGLLSTFDDNLELDVTDGASFQTYTDLGPGSGLPAAALLTWPVATGSPSSTVPTIEGSLVYMTNVYFETPGNFVNGTTAYPITNNTGLAFNVFVSAQDTNFDGQPIPPFATSVTGVLYQTSTTAYSLIVTRYSDIVVPSSVTITNLAAAISAGNLTLTWTAVPNTATYSVEYATNLTGPWSKIATGLSFNNTSGTYTTNVILTNVANFFDVSSP